MKATKLQRDGVTNFRLNRPILLQLSLYIGVVIILILIIAPFMVSVYDLNKNNHPRIMMPQYTRSTKIAIPDYKFDPTNDISLK
jgi:hypothetical protein